MAIQLPSLAEKDFNLKTAIYLARACQVAYDPNAETLAETELGLREVSFSSVNDTEYFHGRTDSFAVLAFRGSQEPFDWFQDARALQITEAGYEGLLHKGFASALHFVWPKVEEFVSQCKVPVFVTGHSLAGSIATLACSRMAGLSKCPFATYTFGSPRVGNLAFTSAYDTVCKKNNVQNFRVVNRMDIVPELPLESEELKFVQRFASMSDALINGNRFFQRVVMAAIKELLNIGSHVQLVVPPSSDIKDLFKLIESLKPFQGQVGGYEHVSTLVTIENDGSITLGGPQLSWARSLILAMFQGQSPAIALQHHKMGEYFSALTGALERPIKDLR